MNKKMNEVFTFGALEDMRTEVMMNTYEGPFDFIYSVDELSDQLEGHDGKSLMRIFGGGDFDINDEWFKFDGKGQIVTIPHLDYVEQVRDEAYIVYQEYEDLYRQDKISYSLYIHAWEEAQYEEIERTLAKAYSQLGDLLGVQTHSTIEEYTALGKTARIALVKEIKKGI